MSELTLEEVTSRREELYRQKRWWTDEARKRTGQLDHCNSTLDEIQKNIKICEELWLCLKKGDV